MADEAMPGGPERLRIVQLETFGRGGLVHYSYNLACALAGRGHDVTLVTTASFELAGWPLPPTLRLLTPAGRLSRGIDGRWPAALATLARKGEALVDAVRVAAAVRRLRPDVVHLHSTNPSAIVYLTLLRRLGVPVVTTAHVVTAHERTRIQDAVSRRIHAAGALVIAHSAFDRGRLVEEFALDPARVAVVPHGEYGFFARDAAPADRVAARHGLGLAEDDEVALFFGYIREYKGLDVLLDAWPSVVALRPRARLVIAGDPGRLGPSRRTELEDRARRLGAVARFGYVPFEQVAPYFAAADLLVMPYRRVSQSGVLFLALATGLPVVATSVGGLPEVLRDGENALLVPPESPEALAGAVARALGAPALRDRLSRGGRELADRHSWTSIAERTEALYRAVLDRHAADGPTA
jgi:glycosyltransferase involved in cell wall biosynthesis